MINQSHIKEAARIFRRARNVNKNGLTEFRGKADNICKSIIKKCYNGNYFQTSLGHFSQFYTRDFGFCAESLVKLGYKKEVTNTLDYALSIFYTHNIIPTTITPEEKPLQIFDYSPDSLPLLLRSLRISGSKKLTTKYARFLEDKAMEYFNHVFDPKTGLVRKDKYFSSIKDNAKRQSSCYDNCMLSMLSDELDRLGLSNPFKDFNIKKNIRKNFWNKEFFLDDLSGKEYLAGDAQVYPFWCDVVKDKHKFHKALWSLQKVGLDRPMPLKYTIDEKNTELIFPLNIVLGDYETNTVWLHLGLCYMDVVRRFANEQLGKYLKEYEKLIETYKTFPELLEPDGQIFRRFHYVSDEGMLWASKYLALKQKK